MKGMKVTKTPGSAIGVESHDKEEMMHHCRVCKYDFKKDVSLV